MSDLAAEFGLYVVVSVVTGVVAASFQEFGGANYLILSGRDCAVA